MISTISITIVVLLRIFSNPLGNVFQKQLTTKGNHPLVVNFLTYFALSIACLFLLFDKDLDQLPSEFWIYSILGGMAGALGNGFLVKALQQGDLSVLGPINAYKSVVGVIAGVLLLKEIPTIGGVVGMVLIIGGSYFVLNTTDERFSWRLLRRKDIQYRIWAMVLTAIEAVLVKKVIVASSVMLSFVSWCWFGAFFSFILLFVFGLNVKQEFRQVKKENLLKYLYLVACLGVMQLATNFTFDKMPVGYALSLFQLSILVSVVFGYKIFNETNIRQKIVGSTIMMVGSILILLSP